MGKFSKKEKASDYFENMKNDTEKDRLESNKKLSDFVNDKDEFKTGTFKIDFTPSSNNSDPLNFILSKVRDDSDNNTDNNTNADSKEFEGVSEIKESENKDGENSIKLDFAVDGSSLLEKCKQFTFDENGNEFVVDNSPIYELKSIAEILKSDSLDAIEQLSKKFHVNITDDTKKTPTENDKSTGETITQNFDFDDENDKDNTPGKTPTFIKMVEESKQTQKTDDQIFEDYLLTNKPDTVVESVTSNIPDISDIDNAQKIDVKNDFEITKETTLRFTPIKDDRSETPKISVSSVTAGLNIKNYIKEENKKITETKLESDDFEDYQVDEEIEDTLSLKNHIIKFAKQKRRAFFQSFISFICLVVLSSNLITPLFDKFVSNYDASLIFISVVSFIGILVNFDMFAGLSKIVSKFATPDSAISLFSLSVLSILIIQLVGSTTDYLSDILYLTVILSFTLFIRATLVFMKLSSKLGSLKQISGKAEKKAITFINDTSVTYSMAKNSIEGDVLICAPRKTGFVKGFLKHYNYSSILNGKFCYYQIIGLILSLVCGIIGYIYYDNIFVAIFCSSLLLSIISLPTLFFINELPLFSAAKKLNPSGAMIAGIEGASRIESSNATVISSTELFPEGTIILKDMKILSNNSIDDTILKAASLAEAVGSTLAPIFRQIAKTNSSYVLPDSDTVKYEERSGITGWVDNELLFIGNRTLLESHGIKVPSLEVDKKILKMGCFPIYLATVDNPCALLIVKYNPSHNIARTLKKVSNLGVTILINNYDPNINEEMIADYFNVYEDTLKIVSNPGMHMFAKATSPVESLEAPASFKYDNLSIANIISSATRIKKSNVLLTILYVVFSVLLIAAFIYSTFSQKSFFPSSKLLLIFELIITLFTTIIYLINKP